MIEQIMFFGLGVLSATLIALLVLPAVWHRAVRLTTRRVEAAVPISIFEVQADKDQQRAAFAVSQRRLELQLDQARNTLVAQATTIERQRQRIFNLEQQLTAQKAAHEALSTAHSDLAARFAAEAEALADHRIQLEQANAALANTRTALAQTTRDLADQTARADEMTLSLAERDTRLIALDGRILELENTLAEARARQDETQAKLEAAEARGRELDTRLAEAGATQATLEAELAEARTALAATRDESAGRGGELDARAGRIAELEAALALSQAEIAALRSGQHLMEHQRADDFARSETDITRLTGELDMLKADHAMMREALERARAARSDAPAGDGPEARAQLKDAILDLAAKVAARAAETPGSPLPDLLAKAERDETGGTLTLAGRIRSARQTEAANAEPDYPRARQVAGE